MKFKKGDIVRWPEGHNTLDTEFVRRYGYGPFIVLGPNPESRDYFHINTLDGQPIVQGNGRRWHTSGDDMYLDPFLMAVRRRRHSLLTKE